MRLVWVHVSAELRAIIRDWRYVVFSLLFPVALFLFFGAPYASEGPEYMPAFLMTSFTAYAIIGWRIRPSSQGWPCGATGGTKVSASPDEVGAGAPLVHEAPFWLPPSGPFGRRAASMQSRVAGSLWGRSRGQEGAQDARPGGRLVADGFQAQRAEPLPRPAGNRTDVHRPPQRPPPGGGSLTTPQRPVRRSAED